MTPFYTCLKFYQHTQRKDGWGLTMDNHVQRHPAHIDVDERIEPSPVLKAWWISLLMRRTIFLNLSHSLRQSYPWSLTTIGRHI